MRVSYIVIFVLLGGLSQPLLAQDTFEEFKKKQNQQFQQFKDERDKEFMKMLNATWKAINSSKGGDAYEEPKPDEMPKVDRPTVIEDSPSDDPVIEDITIPDAETGLEQEQKIEMPESPRTIEGYASSQIEFYAVSVPFSYPRAFDISLDSRIEEQSISKFWGAMGRANYEPMLQQMRSLKSELALNDWGYALLLYNIGQQIYGKESNESVLYTWFMMTKSGYRAKVGYDQQGVYLLVPTESQLYNTRFFEIDGLKHYALMMDNTATVPSSIFTYDGTYPEADRRMDLSIDSTPRLKKNLTEKTFSFQYNDSTYKVPVKIDRNVIAFYKLYPLTDLDIYLEASITSETKTSLLNSLAQIIKGKTELEAANMLLRFVQTAFQYKTDQQQFGYEKYLLPEETLFYEYSDCDDRTIMYAKLIKELLGLSVVGVQYPGHLAAAVHFSESPTGDFVTVDGRQYSITDPTYENANVGMTMPQYKGQKPEILAIE